MVKKIGEQEFKKEDRSNGLKLNGFGWFMSGCYATAYVFALMLDKHYIVPGWIYITLILGWGLTLLFVGRKESRK